jgi:hypothetical protein
MANAVASQATEARTARLAKEVAQDQPTLPSTKYALMFPALLSLLSVAQEADLPEFWLTLAATPKKQKFRIVREALDAYSRSENAFLPLAPVPSPKLVSNLTSLTFVSDHPDNLKTGLHPFIVMD